MLTEFGSEPPHLGAQGLVLFPQNYELVEHLRFLAQSSPFWGERTSLPVYPNETCIPRLTPSSLSGLQLLQASKKGEAPEPGYFSIWGGYPQG